MASKKKRNQRTKTFPKRVAGKGEKANFSRTAKQLPINPLSAKFIKWSKTLKQIVGKLPTICLSVFDHFSGLALKGLKMDNYITKNADVSL